MKDFDPDPCIELWWKDKVRRPDQERRKGSKSGKFHMTVKYLFILDDWDNSLGLGDSGSADITS